MRMSHPLVTLIPVIFIILACGCASQTNAPAAPDTPLPTTYAPQAADTTELVSFVNEAHAYALEHGRAAALEEFNDPAGSFVRGDLYIFAYDFEGNTLALPFQQELIGTNRLDIEDIDGRMYIREMAGAARNGSGFVRYTYTNPAEGYSYEPKISYVTRVDDAWWLGSGIYLSPVDSEAIGVAPLTKEQVKKFVESAVRFARQNDRKTAIEEFQNKTGQFVDGDLYIYALDYDGRVLALPFQPEKVGTSMFNDTDATGQYFTQVEIELARKSGGFVYYLYPNPSRNFTVEPKMSYVQNVDDTYWIGAGTYLFVENAPA